MINANPFVFIINLIDKTCKNPTINAAVTAIAVVMPITVVLLVCFLRKMAE